MHPATLPIALLQQQILTRLPFCTLGVAIAMTPPLAMAAPEVFVRDAVVVERHSGSREVVVQLCVVPAPTDPLTLAYETRSDTASAGNDYEVASGTLTLAAGQGRALVVVQVNGDGEAEADEHFSLVVTAPGVPDALVHGPGQILILDDEPRPRLGGGGHPQVLEGHPAASTESWTLQVLDSLNDPISLTPLAPDSGSAIPGADYSVSATTVPWPNSQAPSVISVTALDDAESEADERILAQLSHPDPRTRFLVYGETFATPPTVPFASGIALGLDDAVMVVGTATSVTHTQPHGPVNGPLQVWEKGASGWSPTTRLDPASPLPESRFGQQVDVSGGTIVVKGSGDAGNAYTPYLYVYEKEAAAPNAWKETTRLPSGMESGFERNTFDLQGDWLVEGGGAGRSVKGDLVFRHRHEGGRDQWGIAQTITAAEVNGTFHHGFLVRWAGDRLAAMDLNLDGSGMKLRVYTLNPNTAKWEEEDGLRTPEECIGLATAPDAIALRLRPLTGSGPSFVRLMTVTPAGVRAWRTFGSATSPASIQMNGDPFEGGMALTRHALVVGDLVFAREIESLSKLPIASRLNPGGYTESPSVTSPTKHPFASTLASDGETIVASGANGVARIFSGGVLAGEVADDESAILQIFPAEATESAAANAETTAKFQAGWGLNGKALPIDVEFTVSTVDGTATGGSVDFTTLTNVPCILHAGTSLGGAIAGSGLSGGFFLRVQSDALTEEDETFFLQASTLSFGQIAPGPGAVGTIKDSLPLITLPTSASVIEGTGTGGRFTIQGRLTKASDRIVTASLRAFASSADPGLRATIGDDVLPDLGSITFQPGQTQVTLQASVVGDDWCESSEGFLVAYEDPVGATILVGAGSVMGVSITDDDPIGGRPDSGTLAQGGKWQGNLAANDCGPTLMPEVAPPRHGEITRFSADGSLTYVPHPNFIGIEAFSYTRLGADSTGPGDEVVGPSAEWKYLFPLTGVDPAVADPRFPSTWNTSDFQDADWLPGTGLMGYGSIEGPAGLLPLTTDIGTPPSGKRHSAYFRHRFVLPVSGLFAPAVTVARDAGVVLYLNGSEFARSGLFAGQVANYTAQAATVDGPSEGTPLTLPGAAVTLPAGPNLLAFSLHNDSSFSSDLAVRIDSLRLFPVKQGLPIPVRLTVTDALRPPMLRDDTYGLGPDDLSLSAAGNHSPYANDGLLDDSGQAFDPLLETEVISGPGGSVESFDPQTGDFQWTPTPGFSGTASFQYRVRDKDGWSFPAVVAIHRLLPVQTFSQWQATSFPPESPNEERASTADPDQDGLINYAEFSLGLDPVSPNTPNMTCSVLGGRVAISFEIAANDRPGITYALESSASLAATQWQTVAVSSGGSTWSLDTPQPEQSFINPFQRRFTFLTGVLADESPTPPARYFRLRIE